MLLAVCVVGVIWQWIYLSHYVNFEDCASKEFII
jgi:hypothetical protein